MERRQFVLLRRYIDKVKAENISIFEKAQQLAFVGTPINIAVRVLCKSSSQSSRSSV